MSFPDDPSAVEPQGDDAFNGEAGESVSLAAALDEARLQAEQAREQQLRAFAELENFRKRTLRDIDQARKYALEKFAGELIGVKDSLEMALAASGQGAAQQDSVLAGVEATLKLLAAAFERAGITELVPQGETFNPEFHEAMVAQPSADAAPNSVLQVIQKGYMLNGRLLRPARVIVAREP